MNKVAIASDIIGPLTYESSITHRSWGKLMIGFHGDMELPDMFYEMSKLYMTDLSSPVREEIQQVD